MKRYRVLTIDYDSRAMILSIPSNNNLDKNADDLWNINKIKIKEGIVAEYGAFEYHKKIDDFVDLGVIPASIIAFHNKFIRQARDAFVIGSYYPCLTSSSALGERILNQLILHLKEYYKNTPEYYKIYRKESIGDWKKAIGTLEAWGVLLPKVVKSFKQLMDIRHRALHFNPETEHNDREMALNAFKKLCEIIEGQFSAFDQPWYIKGTKGATFVKKESENIPFVKEIIIPNCRLVGYLHVLDIKDNQWIVQDDNDYDNVELTETDEEFKELYNNRRIEK